jgi:hypothetical protein
MTTLTISKPTAPGFWAKLLNGFCAFDEALHYDPTEALHHKIERLEARLKDLEADVRSDM